MSWQQRFGSTLNAKWEIRIQNEDLLGRHGGTEKKIQCGDYFAHGNTVAKIIATLLGGRVEGEGRFCMLFQLLFLLELLQKGLREFQMRYSAS
jgi:hypothetical protein